MLYAASRPVAAWLLQTADVASSPSDQLLLSALLALGLIVLVRRKVNLTHVVRQNTWLMVLMGYMLLSVFWSDIPFISFKRWIREFEALVMGLIVLSEKDARQALGAVLRRVIYIHIPLSWLLIKFYPEYGVQYNRWTGDLMWVGVTTQKNGLGILCLISIFFIIWAFMGRWKASGRLVLGVDTYADVFVLILAVLLLKGPPGAYSSTSGYSSTSIAALVLGLTTYFGLSWMKGRGLYMGANTLSALLVLILCYGTALPLAGGLLGGLTSALGRDSTFTGRTDIWASLVPVVQQEPILGCGFGGFWTPETRAIHIVGQAHNGYLEVLIELGGVGLVLVSMFLLSSLRKAARSFPRDFDWACLCICFVLIAAIHNSTEASINTLTNFLTALVLFAGLVVGVRQAKPEPIRGVQAKSTSRAAASPIRAGAVPFSRI